MSDSDRLSDKIAKFADKKDEIGADGRRISSTDLRDAIVDEIDETILPREITFRNSRGETLVLEVSGRRLLRIAAAPDLPETATTALSGDADAQIAALRGSLQGYLDAETELSVRTRGLAERPEMSVVGLSAEALRALLSDAGGTSQIGAEDTPGLDGFIAGLGARGATLSSQTGEVQSWGTPPKIAEADLAQALGLLDTDGPGAIVLTSNGSGSARLIGRTHDAVLLADADEAALLKGAARWKDLIG